MKNRAGWLALLVLAIATLLMVFVIIPRISEPEKAAEAPSAPATQQPAATPPAPVDVAGEALEKMGRLGKAADEAVAGLTGLFADNKVPSADAFAAARAAAETAVSALATLEIPEALEAAAKDSLATARGHAEKALALIKALPADPREAVSAIGAIAGALKGEPAPQSSTMTPATTPAAGASADTAASDAPRFDLLRVEPDGSTVIAGNAVPGSKIDILNGDTVIASAEVGPSGDFAAVLDTPLKPGDHALALRSTDPAGKTVVSEEVASVSVPESDDGKLLALISKPGEASRIITLPEAVNEADKQSRLASAEAPATPALPAASLDLTSTPPIGAEPSSASAPQAATQPASQPATLPSTTVQVTAVEIEGDKIFIAGTASTAGAVRAFADDQLVGNATIDGAGHFVVEGRMALAVGDHTVSVELLDSAGQVVVRASVPFNRPEGTQVAVVAAAADSASGTMVPLDRGAFDKQLDNLAKAYDILRAQFADGKEPALEGVAAARSATEIALKSLSEFRLASDAPAAMTEAVGKTALAAREALTLMEGLANTVEAVRDNLPKIAGLIDAVLKAAPPATADSAAPVAQEAMPAAGQSASADTGTEGTPTINQAPLQKSENSVIIRQGDTLWQISRRVYGQGVRYTTIYLANEDQIVNPDLIEPGQIFKVPGEALPNAEEIHRKRLSGQPID